MPSEPLDARLAHHEVTAHECGPRTIVATATGPPRRRSRRDALSSGRVSGATLLDEDLEDAAAREPDRERVVVADAVRFPNVLAGGEHPGRRRQRALDAAAAHRAHGPPLAVTSIDAPAGAARSARCMTVAIAAGSRRARRRP